MLLRVSDTEFTPHRLAPGLGEHTDELLAELGCSPTRSPSSAPGVRSGERSRSSRGAAPGGDRRGRSSRWSSSCTATRSCSSRRPAGSSRRRARSPRSARSTTTPLASTATSGDAAPSSVGRPCSSRTTSVVEASAVTVSSTSCSSPRRWAGWWHRVRSFRSTSSPTRSPGPAHRRSRPRSSPGWSTAPASRPGPSPSPGEPGTSPASRSRAAANDEGWVLSGTKSYVQDAGVADTWLVTARTGEGLTQFLVPADTRWT